jgi:hypothetical protein
MQKNRRRKTVALVAASLTLGIVVAGTPATAHVGGWVHNWNNHIKPKADAHYMPGGKLPPGKTVRGAYDMGGTAAGASSLATAEIAFGHRVFLAQPTPHFIAKDTTPPPECPGTSENPKAKPGHLCIYERFVTNAGNRNTTGPQGDGSAWPFGAGLFIRSTGTGTFFSVGTWAATSGPASTTVARAPAGDPTVHGIAP